ncbi:MAG: hypothetical protein KBD31_05625, partial [Proteobacteria bacterium]|nr:hypothetical protein [Pseudomonadota bacterium]
EEARRQEDARRNAEEEARRHAEEVARRDAAAAAQRAEEARLDGLARQVEEFSNAKNWSAAADILKGNPGILDRTNLSPAQKLRVNRA